MKIDKNKRIILIIITLLALSSLSIYSLRVGPEKDPTTVEVLDNPQRHESKELEVRGTVENFKIENNTLSLYLEKYGRRFGAIYEIGPEENFEDMEIGDKIRLLGSLELEHPEKNIIENKYIEAYRIYHRSQRRQNALTWLSALGALILLAFIIADRKKLKEMIVDA